VLIKWEKTSQRLLTQEVMVKKFFKNHPRGVEKKKFVKNGLNPVMHSVSGLLK